MPCYTFRQGNIALLHVFKGYCAILFPKGALLHDAAGILVQQTKNTQAHRQVRFTSVQQIAELAATLEAYVYEAIEVEKLGLEVNFKATSECNMPEELQQKLLESPALTTAFESLTPGRQRAYLLYFAAPKQSKTRTAKVEKYRQSILDGKGLNA